MSYPHSNAAKTRAIMDGMDNDAGDARDAADRARTAVAVAHAITSLIRLGNGEPSPMIRRAEQAAGAIASDGAETAASEAVEAAERAEAAANIGSEPPNMSLVPECEIAVAGARAAAAEARAAARHDKNQGNKPAGAPANIPINEGAG